MLQSLRDDVVGTKRTSITRRRECDQLLMTLLGE